MHFQYLFCYFHRCRDAAPAQPTADFAFRRPSPPTADEPGGIVAVICFLFRQKANVILKLLFFRVLQAAEEIQLLI